MQIDQFAYMQKDYHGELEKFFPTFFNTYSSGKPFYREMKTKMCVHLEDVFDTEYIQHNSTSLSAHGHSWCAKEDKLCKVIVQIKVHVN